MSLASMVPLNTKFTQLPNMKHLTHITTNFSMMIVTISSFILLISHKRRLFTQHLVKYVQRSRYWQLYKLMYLINYYAQTTCHFVN